MLRGGDVQTVNARSAHLQTRSRPHSPANPTARFHQLSPALGLPLGSSKPSAGSTSDGRNFIARLLQFSDRH